MPQPDVLADTKQDSNDAALWLSMCVCVCGGGGVGGGHGQSGVIASCRPLAVGGTRSKSVSRLLSNQK